MRLSDAGLQCQQTKLIYPDHPLRPWLTEDATPRSLEPMVRHFPRGLQERRIHCDLTIFRGATFGLSEGNSSEPGPQRESDQSL
jgi:hypothetical protein